MNYFLGKNGVYGDDSDREYFDDLLPEGYAVVNLREMVRCVSDDQATGKTLAVFMALCSGDITTSWMNENGIWDHKDGVSMGMKRIAEIAGVSIGTVWRALKYFEKRGFIKRLSQPKQRLFYQINRKIAQKDLPTK